MEAVILFLFGIALVVFNARAVLKEKHSFKNDLELREKSFGDTDMEIGEIRKEFGETIFEIQQQIEDLKKNKENHDIIENEEPENKLENYNNVKIDEIKKMIDEDVPIDEISEKTGIGKGELILIKQLYIR